MFGTDYAVRGRIAAFMAQVYGWMAFALCITAAVSYGIASNLSLFSYIFSNRSIPILLFVVQIGLVIALSSLVRYMNYATAVLLFVLYAATLGVTMSTIFFAYSLSAIYMAFFITGGTFGAMALYGYTTKTDLSSMGSFAIMALFGLILSQFVNMYFQSAFADQLISGIGVLLFTALTAYDVQNIKQFALIQTGDEQEKNKGALLGALVLYLDFINLFLFILRFMNKKD
ncbi:MAG TPA: Bax inhibitor-1/YccA family protein [Candidatus Babeliales bacterium]|nr:Bax inhibitor-1/YccA family protein [Candidatus Babeliales bacterium]